MRGLSPEAAAVAGGLCFAGAAAWRLRLVRPSGALGGAALGWSLWALRGGGALLVFAVFACLGLLVSRWPDRRTAGAGDPHPPRAAAHALANGAAGLACALAGWWGGPQLGARADAALVAAFAAAAADTLGSELGRRWSSRSWVLVPRPASAPPGTPGALSVAGTIAALGGAAVVAGGGMLAGVVPGGVLPAVLGAALVGMLADALLGACLLPGPGVHHLRNLAGTSVAAALVWAGWGLAA